MAADTLTRQIASSVETLADTTTKSLKTLQDENKNLKADLDTLKKSVAKFGETPSYTIQGGNSPGKLFAVARDPNAEGAWGFKSFGHFLHTVRNAEKQSDVNETLRTQLSKGWDSSRSKGGYSDETKAVSGMSETVDSEGGYLVPPQFSNNIFQRVYENDLLKRTDQYTVTGRTMIFPCIDERSRVDGSRFGGVQAYWRDEAAQGTSTKPKMRQITLTLKSLMALGYMTEELQQDMIVTGDAFLTKNFAMEISFKVGAAIVLGTGVGQPQGILNAPCTVSVAKDTGQAAATITATNIWNMYRRLWAPSQANAVWFINQDCLTQLLGMTMPGATPAYPVFMPPGGISAAPYGTLLGLPVVPIEFCSTVGTVGDIILADLTQYVTIGKGSLDTQMSMHLRFDYAENAFRTIFRMDGMPWWQTSLTPFKGSLTLSPFISLATRA